MKPVSPELLTLLATRQFFVADLYTFALIGGGVLRYCGGDADIVANGFLYPAGGAIGPYFDRADNKAKCHWQVGVETDTLVFDMLPGAAKVFGTPMLTAIHSGLFDGAELTLERAYMPVYGDTSRGTVRYFVGRVAEIDAGRSVATFSVNSHLELLNLQLPRNLYQPGCINNLGDASCGVDLDAFKTVGTVAAGSTNGIINVALTGDGTFPAGTFDLGTIAFTAGALSGLSRTIKTCVFGTPDVVTLLGYLPAAPAAGDAFTLFFGCDKTDGLVLTTVGNTFAGESYVQVPPGLIGLQPGMVITAAGVPSGALVESVVFGETVDTVTMNVSGTITAAPVDMSFQSLNGCLKFARACSSYFESGDSLLGMNLIQHWGWEEASFDGSSLFE